MTDLKPRLKKLIADRMNLSVDPVAIRDDQPLFDHGDGSLGLDSIDALDLVVGMYEEFGIELQESDMAIFASVNAMAAFVEERQLAAAK